jgi:glucan biosynthesis protein
MATNKIRDIIEQALDTARAEAEAITREAYAARKAWAKQFLVDHLGETVLKAARLKEKVIQILITEDREKAVEVRELVKDAGFNVGIDTREDVRDPGGYSSHDEYVVTLFLP